ncbi:NAD(P)-dependent oxidoreductase [Celeribacter sp.]|uniref:siroheme synthase n=1 Tax=Celeribacter sp. TaxID=1890673 RepID=UPI003A8D6AEE
MNFFPMFLRMADRDVIVVGGGETAAQKVRLLRKTGARVTVHAPELCRELRNLVAFEEVIHADEPLSVASFEGAALVFLATGCPGIDASLHPLVRQARALVNVVDQPHLCEANTPSIVDRSPLVVAIGTEGAAPILGRQLKTRIEQILEPDLGRLVRLAGGLRPSVAQLVPKEQRRAFWRWVFAGAPRQLFVTGREQEAAELIGKAIGQHGSPEGDEEGLLSLVPYTSRMADLMTLRAVQRLQEADVVIHRRGDNTLLELARRDAERFEMADAMNASKRVMFDVAHGSRVVWLLPHRELAAAVNLLSCAHEIVPHVELPNAS